MKSKQNKVKKVVGIIISLIGGGLIGLAIIYISDLFSYSSTSAFVFNYFFNLLLFYFTYFLQLIIHESGHLIFGLLTGYKFLSFRILSYMFYKINDQYHFGKYSLAGTGGQCLMYTDQQADENFPFVLFHLGGVIMNLITAIIFGILYLIILDNPFISIFNAFMAISGLIVFLTNGIPLDLAMVQNDGKNVVVLLKSKKARKALLTQLLVNKNQLYGIRLREMNPSYFDNLEGENDKISNVITILKANYLVDKGEYDEALEYIKQLLDNKAFEMLGIYENLLTCDKMTLQLLCNENFDEEKYKDKQFNVFLKQMQNYPSILRLQYLVNKYHFKDETKADEYLKKLDKLTNTYPYKTDIDAEFELIKAVKDSKNAV